MADPVSKLRLLQELKLTEMLKQASDCWLMCLTLIGDNLLLDGKNSDVPSSPPPPFPLEYTIQLLIMFSSSTRSNYSTIAQV